MSEAVFSEEQYVSLKNAIIENDFNKVFTLMGKISDLEMQLLNLQSRYSRYTQEKNGGATDKMYLEEKLNGITESIIGVIQPHIPQIEDNSEASSSSSNSNYAFKISSSTDRKLQRTQKILGRDEKIAEIYPLLGKKAPALLLKGEGGIGKTDFCKILLEKYLEENPDAQVWWIDVEYIDSVESLVGTLALSLGLAETTTRATVLEKLSEQPALYYLDNLESITDAKTASDFLSQLTTINNVYWLASSRSKINNWKTETIEELDANAALQVFLNQWANSSGEELEHPQPELTEFIDKDLGFHPLSIILAASRGADYFDVSEVIAAWKVGEATVREKEASDAGHRLTNLDLSLELSYNALKDSYAKQLWAICAFFPQGMGKEDLKYFVEKRDFPLSARAELIKRSILRNKGGKLTLLPPFADYMKRKLEGEEEAVFVENSLGFCLEFTREGIVPHSQWLARMPYIFEFIKYVVNKFEKYPKLWELYEKMFNDWVNNILIGKEILEKVLKNDFWNKEQSYKANCLFNLGYIEFVNGEYKNAKRLLKRAKSFYEKIGDNLGKANVLANLGRIELNTDNTKEAKIFYNQAEILYKQENDDLGRANIFRGLGFIEFLIEEYDKAKIYFKQAEVIYVKMDFTQGRANILKNLGQVECSKMNHKEGFKLLKNSILLSKDCAYLTGELTALIELGRYSGIQKNKTDTVKYFSAAKKIANKIGVKKDIKIVEETEAKALKNCE